MHKNFKNIEKVVYGRGSFDMMSEILEPVRKQNDHFFLFVVDNYFKGKELEKRLPATVSDVVRFIDVDPHEPTTEQIDTLRDEVLHSKGLPSGVIGIGGGSIMDIAKAVSLMFTNEGSSTLYQGLNLVKKQGIYHLGVPTNKTASIVAINVKGGTITSSPAPMPEAASAVATAVEPLLTA